MIPSFLTWLETDENPALGAPMHKQGSGKNLDGLVEDWMLRLTKDLMDGKRTEQEILAAVQNYVKKKTTPESTQPPDAQANEINPVAQGPAPGNF